jgi:hypothetical protein
LNLVLQRVTLQFQQRERVHPRVHVSQHMFVSPQRPSVRRSNRGAAESFFIHTPFLVGKYLVSPLTRLNDNGRYAASVSIRSGRGSATHDRVLRFVPVFDSSTAAARYAFEQGIAWLEERRAATSDSSTPQDQYIG